MRDSPEKRALLKTGLVALRSRYPYGSTQGRDLPRKKIWTSSKRAQIQLTEWQKNGCRVVLVEVPGNLEHCWKGKAVHRAALVSLEVLCYKTVWRGGGRGARELRLPCDAGSAGTCPVRTPAPNLSLQWLSGPCASP